MFTKGQNVKRISRWGDASWYVQDAIVTACGKKQMTLVDAHTGKPMGSTYKPTEEQRGDGLVMDCSMDEAKRIALVKAQFQRDDRLAYLRDRAANHADAWYRNNAAEELAKLEATPATVETPYEPGHKYGPKEGEVIVPHVPRKKGTTYLARYNGEIVGQRVSHNAYTHAVIVRCKDGSFAAASFSRSRANAQKLKPFSPVVAIVEVEVKA